MGFNATYTLIRNRKGLDSLAIANAFTNLLKKECKLIEDTTLSFETWNANKNLFCIVLTPLTCFDLSGSDYDTDWTLVTISYYAEELKNWDWEAKLSKDLHTTIDIFGVGDSISHYTHIAYENGHKISDQFSEEICYTTIQFFVAEDFYELKGYPDRINDDGEHYLIFESKKRTHYRH